MTIENINKSENQMDQILSEKGFICNNQFHWFSIRQVGKTWFNLNSVNKYGPEIISDFYLSAFLLSVKQNGYSIFVVRGIYPDNAKSIFPHFEKNQKYIPIWAIEVIQ